MSEALLYKRKAVSQSFDSFRLTNPSSARSYSLLPAISLDGMVDCVVVENAFNASLFAGFIASLLDKMNPFPAPRSVIVMDNCSIHKAPEIRQLIESKLALSLSLTQCCADVCIGVSDWSV